MYCLYFKVLMEENIDVIVFDDNIVGYVKKTTADWIIWPFTGFTKFKRLQIKMYLPKVVNGWWLISIKKIYK